MVECFNQEDDRFESGFSGSAFFGLNVDSAEDDPGAPGLFEDSCTVHLWGTSPGTSDKDFKDGTVQRTFPQVAQFPRRASRNTRYYKS